MEALSYRLNIALLLVYGLTVIVYFFLFTSNGKRLNKTSRALLIFSAITHIVYLSIRAAGEKHIPLTTQGEALTFFALAILLVYIYLELRLMCNVMGIFIIAIVFGFQLLATIRYSPFTPMKPVLQSGWFAFHASTAVLSFAAFAISALLSILYLLLFREINAHKPGYIFQRIPSLEALDEMAYKSVTLGFLLLTAGIGSGAIWADQIWGKFWNWDPKQVSSLVVWLVYAAYLHARLQKGWEGKRVAIFAAFGFGTLIFTFIFVDLLFKTVHKFI